MSASGALEMKTFSPERRKPSPSGSATSESEAASDPASGSVSANAGDRLAGRDARHPDIGDLRPARGQDRVRPEALERKGDLGLGREARQPLADEAEIEDREIAPGVEHLGHEAVCRERGDQRTVDAARLATPGDRRQHIAGERLAANEQRPLRLGEVRVGGAHPRTATPTSSTSARGSRSSVTPISAIAG